MADIAAVRPTYKSRFLAFAAAHPRLTDLVWHATEAVEWHWRFKRVGDDKVEVASDEAQVPYEKEEEAEQAGGGGARGPMGIFMRMPGFA